jgi:prepilin-type N-terminal cleavage/methylation domain-containing protein
MRTLWRPVPRDAGFSLVELMIAMTLGLLIMTALVAPG